MRYKVEEDIENDCLSIEDNEFELTNSFGSEQLMLHPIEDANPIINRLQFLEEYVKILEGHLRYFEFTDKDFRDCKEEAELNLEYD